MGLLRGTGVRVGAEKGTFKKMTREIMVSIPELVQYITWLASEREEALSSIRLVRFLDGRISPKVATGKGAA